MPLPDRHSSMTYQFLFDEKENFRNISVIKPDYLHISQKSDYIDYPRILTY